MGGREGVRAGSEQTRKTLTIRNCPLKTANFGYTVRDRARSRRGVHAMIESLLEIPGRILCFLGFHDFKMIDASFSFGPGGSVSRVECRRCGYVTTRLNR